jgi:hypothetical protein
MLIVFNFFGLRFMFFSNNHKPVHTHVVEYPGSVREYAVFQVDPAITLLNNQELSTHKLKLADRVIEGNKDLITQR